MLLGSMATELKQDPKMSCLEHKGSIKLRTHNRFLTYRTSESQNMIATSCKLKSVENDKNKCKVSYRAWCRIWCIVAYKRKLSIRLQTVVLSRTIQRYLSSDDSVGKLRAYARSLTAGVASVKLFGLVQTGYVRLLWKVPSTPRRKTWITQPTA